MSVFNLDRMFQPKSVVVVGASEKKGSPGAAVMQNLIGGGYAGRLYPVNPHHETVSGHKVYSAIRDIPDEPDLAVVVTPIRTVPEIVKACREKNAGGVVVISSGGKEIGEAGAAVEAQIREALNHTGLRVIGPNCLGIISGHFKLNASFANHMPRTGKMAFISQSGAICTTILDFAAKENIGFSYFVSLGSMLDVDFGDLIDYVGGDPAVSSIVMYVENLSRIRNFMSAARAVSRVKPIIALKAGRTHAGSIAAASHTGALAGEDAVYDAAFKRAGIVRVKTFAELCDCAECLGKQPRLVGSGLAIVSNAGGPGVMAADALSDYGLEPAPLREETLGRLNEILPPHWSHGNPVDIVGDATVERYRQVVDLLAKAPEVDALLIMLAPQALSDPVGVAEALATRLRDHPSPVFTAWMGGRDVQRGREIFHSAGIPTFDSPERAVRAFADLYRHAQHIDMLKEIPEKRPSTFDFDRGTASSLIHRGIARPDGLLTESEAKALLSAYAIPVNPTRMAADPGRAVQIAREMGFPVAMKVNSREIEHKTDVGGVVLDIQDTEGVLRAYDLIHTNVCARYPAGAFDGVSIQPMLQRPGYELIMGAKKDPDFGPVILLGMGGVLTEIIKDSCIALPPLNRQLAHRMMAETRIYRIFSGYRNLRAVDTARVEEMLICLSHLVTDFPEIDAIDINPVIVTGNTPCAVDARVVVRDAALKAPMHLAISPYPNEYEEMVEIQSVGTIRVRPIRPEDALLLSDMFHALSPMSVYYRFFGPMRELPPSMLARFTQIDYDREIAMVAVTDAPEGEKMLGVARVIIEHNLKRAEFSVLVRDALHGKGIGATLLNRCLSIAQTRNIETVWGMVLSDNTKMLALGRKLGFIIRRDPETNEYELTIHLREPKRG